MDRMLAEHLARQGMSANTIRIYVGAYRRWADYSQHPLDLTATELAAWADTLPPSHGTRSHAKAMVKHVSEVLESCGVHVDGEPWEAVRVPSQKRRKSRAVSPEQAKALVRAAHRVGGREGLAVLIGLYTAARRSEIAGMRWDGINWNAPTIRFWRPKNRDWHTVPLHPELQETLQYRFLPGEVWLFPGRNGGHISPVLVGEWTKLVAAVAGVPRVTTHVLRHTALTTVNDATRDLRAAQELAGHSKPSTTAIYSRVSEERMVKAVEALDY